MTQSPLASIHVATLRALLDVYRAKGDTVAARLIQTELFYRQPIVTHAGEYGDWIATRGDYDLDCTVGWGRSEADAVADLLDIEEDQRADGRALPVDDGGMAEERARHP
jgi:hypothetical protein